jgi:nucleoside-diphosphate-sugar epimerase
VGDNDYHNSKILAKKKVHEFIKKRLDAYIVRPTITCGPGDDGFPMTLVKMVKKRIFLLPQKDIKIHLLNVFSFAGLLCKVLKSHNLKQRVFIAADESPVSLIELGELIHYHYPRKNSLLS